MKKTALLITIRLILFVCFSFAVFIPLELRGQFAKGADIGWLSQMEASNRKFYDKNGVQKDLLDILKDYDINSIRFRVWVNPSAGYCNKADVIKQAVRCKNKGYRIMIDFHYSDGWADPGQQTKPAAWNAYSVAQLKTAIAAHTTDVLTGLRDAGVWPEWVQVGNETNNGMLWPDGQASSNMANFAAMVTSGYDAVKAVFPTTKVIVHISNGYDNALFRWMFDGLKANNAKWDVIGMSLYPDQSGSTSTWQTYDPKCLANIKDMVSRYGKEVVMAEVGMPWSDANSSFDFLTDILAKNRSVSQSLGVFYWEPESYNGWQGYQKGAFDNSGKPTHAMDAFLEGNTAANNAPIVSISSPSDNASFKTGSDINISAVAQDADGSIFKVAFFNGANRLGEDSVSPYTMLWPGVAAGPYTITAVAYDNKGTIANSAGVNIVVSNTVTGIDEEYLSMNYFNVYPNPFESVTNVLSDGDFIYQVFDSEGRELIKAEASSLATIGGDFPKGMYLVKIIKEGRSRSMKICKW